MLKKNLKLFPLILIFLPLVYSVFVLDNDFWFIINHGRYIVNNGFTFIEPFTVHEGLKFSFEKWLTSVLFFYIYECFGPVGMKVFLVIIFALILFALYKTAYYVSKNRNVSIIITMLFGFAFTRYYIVTRPQVFSYLLLIIEFLLTEKYANTNNAKYLYPLPLLSLLYFQLHSTMWIMFFIMLLPYLFDLNVISTFLKCENTNYDKKKLILFTILSFFAGFLNPNGIESVFYIFKSLDVIKVGIYELMIPTTYDFLYLCGVLVTIEIFAFLSERRVLPLRYIYILLGTSILGISAVRNTSYFQIYHAIIICYMLKDYDLTWLNNVKLNPILNILITISIIWSVCSSDMYLNNNRGELLLDDLKNDIGCDYVSCGETKVLTDFNTGSYAEWLGFKTYIDPRAELFYKSINGKEDIMTEWQEIYYKTGEYETLMEKYNFDYWLIENSSEMYKKIIKDERFEVYNENNRYTLLKEK